MDWGTFIAYIVILVNFIMLSIRLGDTHRHVRRLEAKVSYLAFVVTSVLLEERRPEDVRAMLAKMGQEVKEEMTFAEIARKEGGRWWRRRSR